MPPRENQAVRHAPSGRPLHPSKTLRHCSGHTRWQPSCLQVSQKPIRARHDNGAHRMSRDNYSPPLTGQVAEHVNYKLGDMDLKNLDSNQRYVIRRLTEEVYATGLKDGWSVGLRE